MRYRTVVLMVLLTAHALWSCSSQPERPTDQVLLNRFANKKEDYILLVKLLNTIAETRESGARFIIKPRDLASSDLEEADKAKCRAFSQTLGIRMVYWSRQNPVEVWFAVWFEDLPGPGAHLKGYGYVESRPDVLKEDLDQHWKYVQKEGELRGFTANRHIENGWYLVETFYH